MNNTTILQSSSFNPTLCPILLPTPPTPLQIILVHKKTPKETLEVLNLLNNI